MALNIDSWLANLRDERDGAALYDGLASLEKDPVRSRKFAELAEAERRHAGVWARKLETAGVALPPDRVSTRTRMLLWLARRLGISAVMPSIMQDEERDAEKYARQGGDAADLAREEKSHREVLGGMGGPTAEAASSRIVRRERWHRGGRAGSLRAAVFGMNDGLVSNLSLVLGVAGAGVEQQTLLLTGFAGLLAGACSMAAGEYSSVASQRDLLRRQVELEARELAEAPEEEADELSLIYRQKGLSEEQARRTANELLKNPSSALDTLVREELGLDPGDLGSPLAAAGSSFAMFSVGAALPILPFIFVSDRWVAVASSSSLAALVLALVGAGLGVLAGTSPWRSAGRMLGLAALAAGVTFGLGRLFGTTLG
jgi:VIT1/CCC1 family predicted Fe2+/Mn2+ transporter